MNKRPRERPRRNKTRNMHMSETLPKCDCCGNALSRRKFFAGRETTERNYVEKGETAICYECAGFYLAQTYLNNSTASELRTIASEARDLKMKERIQIETMESEKRKTMHMG